MDIEIRYARPEELPAVADLDGASFGIDYSPQDLADVELDIDLDTMLVALDGDRVVGASCEVPFTLTLPGGSADALGLTWVSVEATHRRQGILTALMTTQLRAAADRGVPVSVLTASEAGIYGRYGFGVGTRVRHTVVDRAAARLAAPVRDHGVTRVSTADARDVLPGLYERWHAMTPGALDRNDRRWQLHLLERDWSRAGRSKLLHLVHADGYVSYRIAKHSSPLGPRNACVIVDYVVCSPQAHAALWQVLLGLDLCATIESDRIALDDPLPHLLTDPRQVTTTALTDGLWVRPLDIAAAVSARSYALDVDVVLEVRDPLLGAARSYRLRGGSDGAQCAPTDDPAQVHLDVAALGAVLLGGVRLGELARAGLVDGEQHAIARLDRAMLADREPQLGTYF